MLGEEIYKIYAPLGAKWVNWVRPVPFVAINTYDRKPIANWINREAMFLDKYKEDTAIFVDLPGKESIELGIGLARWGYRPIPVFNGTDEQKDSKATNDTYMIESCLINGGQILKNIQLRDDANPAFLLDSARTDRYRANESIFDNTWDLYGQDIPSVEFFKSNGITKIIIVSRNIQIDLRKIFFKFQFAGIEIYHTDGYLPIKKVKLVKTIRERFEKEEL